MFEILMMFKLYLFQKRVKISINLNKFWMDYGQKHIGNERNEK